MVHCVIRKAVNSDKFRFSGAVNHSLILKESYTLIIPNHCTIHHYISIQILYDDALALRYGWLPANMPTSCACGAVFSVEHALSCPKGGFPSIRHNEIRDYTAYLLSEICHNVSTEPHFQPIRGEVHTYASANFQDGARLDAAADGFWGSRFERAFIVVKVFNPYAPSNRRPQPSA